MEEKDSSWRERFLGDHPNFQICIQVLRNPRLLPLYPVLILFLASVGGTLFSRTPERRTMMALVGDFRDQVSDLISNPWFHAAYIIAAFYAIFWAARDVGRKKTAEASRYAAAQQRRTSELRDEFRGEREALRKEISSSMAIGTRLAEVTILSLKINKAAEFFEIANENHNNYARFVSSLKDGRQTLRKDENLGHMAPSIVRHLQTAAGILGVEVKQPNMDAPPKPETMPQPDGGLASNAMISIPDNSEWVKWHCKFRDNLQMMFRPVKAELDHIRAEREHLIKLIAGLPHDR